MQVKVNIDPALRDSGLQPGIEAISTQLRKRAESLPKYIGNQVELNWHFRKMPGGGSDPQLITLRIRDAFVELDDTFTTIGVRNAINPGEPDAAYWVHQLWDKYLRSRLDYSLQRMDELISAEKE